MKLTSNYSDLLFNEAANAEWCEFIADKIRGIVHDPATAEQLIPTDHRFGEKRPPFVDRLLRGVQRPEGVARRPPRDADRAGDRDRHRDDRRPARVRHHRVGDRLRLRHRCAARAWASAVATGSSSTSTGPTARRPSSASRPAGSPTSSSPAARTPPPATTPATTATRSTSSPTCSSTPAKHGYDVIEVSAESEERWTRMVDKARGPDDVRHDRPVRRRQHPGQAAALPAQRRRAPEAVRDHRRRRGPRLRRLRAVEPARRPTRAWSNRRARPPRR